MDTTPTTAQSLAAEGITDYAQDLRQLSAAALLRLFAFTSSGKMNATRVIKNLIWQGSVRHRTAVQLSVHASDWRTRR